MVWVKLVPLLMLLFASSFAVRAKTEVTFFSSSAADEQSSPETFVFDYLRANLNDYKVSEFYAGLERSLQLLPDWREGCIRNLVKNPSRESMFDFSLPETLFLGIKAYLSPQTTALLDVDNNTVVDLATILTEHHLVVGIDKERSYGTKIDTLLAALPEARKYVKQGIENEERMARMLFSNRIDVWLEYQTVMDLYHQQHIPGQQLKSFYVQGAPRYVYSHIACKKTAESPQLIAAINRVLQQLYRHNEYYQAHINLIGPNLKDNFDEMFKQFLAELPVMLPQ